MLFSSLLAASAKHRSLQLATRSFTSRFARSMASIIRSDAESNIRTRFSTVAKSHSLVRTCPTSFDDGMGPFEITTPIYYVNDKPHIGHAYTSTACDVIARFMRLSGREVFFLTGTDEHGQKVEHSAKKKGLKPKAFCDEVCTSFLDLLGLMNISNDKFIRTTDEKHKVAVQHLWNTLVDKGTIYLGAYEGWYSIRDECYYTESELIDGKAPTGADVEWVVKEPSYFFKLSEYEDKLLDLYESHPDFIAPKSRRNEMISFVKGGLRDLSISRTSFSWGVPVPGDDDHVVYVWVDALANYISALGYPNIAPDSMFSKYWPASLHVIGKDIQRFHAIYWPAILMAADLPIPKRLFVHGWWTKEGEKMSKSLGNAVDPIELVERFGADQTRFFLMAEVGLGNDGDFSYSAMIRKINANLANELGNLCQRTLSLAFKNCEKSVPAEVGEYTKEDEALLASARGLREKTSEFIAEQAIQKYTDAMVSMVWDANKYIDVMEPWKLRKTDPNRMATVIYVIMEVLRYVSILYQPVIPTGANTILDQLTVPENERSFAHLDDAFAIKKGNPIAKPQGIFPRFEVPTEEPE